MHQQFVCKTALAAVFFCCLVSVATTRQPLRVTQQLPNSIVVRELTSLNLHCAFEPQPDYIMWRFAQSGQPLRSLIRCQPSEGTCGSLNKAQTGFVNVSVAASANGSLTVNNLGQGHSGRYQCEGLLKLESARTETAVSVLVAPTLPAVTANASQPVASSSLRLVCATSGGNPPPILTWQIRTGLVDSAGFEPATADSVAPGATEAPVTPFGVVTSQLTLTRIRSELNRAVVRCLATHPVANLTSPDYVLDVLYHPIVTAMPPLSIELGSTVTVECSATGNPDPMVQLENSVEEILSAVSPLSVRYRLTAHQPSQSGVYRCVGSNSLGSSNASFAVDVQYGPKVSGPGLVTARAGDRLTIECSVDANPPADLSSVKWTHVSSGRTVSGAGSSFVIEQLDRSDAGFWRCRYANTLRPTGQTVVQREGAADTTVIVEYAPGLPVTSAAERQLVAGESLNVVCSANADSPGVPSPTFRWTKAGSLFESLGPSLTLANVSLTDSGVYFCTPTNSAGQGPTTSVSVDVEQPPEWLKPQPRPTVTASVSTSKDFRLECTARAKPEASFAWYKDGRLIPTQWFTVETGTDMQNTGAGGYRTTSYLNFRGAQRTNSDLRPEDNGRYLCEASNKRGKISAEIPLIVEFKPQIDTVETKIAKPDGLSVDFSCPVLAQPRPSITWQQVLPSGESVGIDMLTRFESDPSRSYRYLSHLERVSSLGVYRCLATNSLGSTQLNFRVVEPTVPDPPTELQVLASGWDFVTLTWSKAFSGGSPVQYWSRVLTRDPATGQVRTATRRCDTSTRTNITGLLPGTNYTIQIYGLNSLGQSNYSSPISLVTAGLSLPKPRNVQLIEDGKKLSVTMTDAAGYCLRIESSEDSGSSWSLYQYCLAVDSSPIIVTGVNGNLLYRVSVCLARREEVCGLSTLSTASMASLPQVQTSTIIIVGSSCLVVILVLISVLTYFCCKRPKVYKEMDPLTATRNARQPSPSSSHCQYGQVPDVLVPPHPSFSADDVASVAAAAAAGNLSGHSGSSGASKPLIPQPRLIDNSASARRSSTFLHSKSTEAAAGIPASRSCGPRDFQLELHHHHHHQQQQQQHQQQPQQKPMPPTSFTSNDRRRSGGQVVFATLGSGHSPLDSSASNPALFSCYPPSIQHQQVDFTDDNRNTDPYSFEGNYSMRQKKIVYEVVV